MPRYFFDVSDGEYCNRDTEGINLSNLDQVWEIVCPMLDQKKEIPSSDVLVIVRDCLEAEVFRSDAVFSDFYIRVTR